MAAKRKEPPLTLGEAAKRIGVSADTLRRWERAGKLKTERDERNRRLVPVSEVRRLSASPDRHRTGDSISARNRFPGIVESIELDGLIGIVELRAGPHRVTSVITRDAIEELNLTVGDRATAFVKATSVMVIKEKE